MTKTKNLLVLMLVLALGVFTACGDDSPKETEQQVKTRQLSKTWNITAVDVTGSGDYDYTSGQSKIEFTSGGNFTVTNPARLPEIRNPFGVFPAAGTWVFANTTSFNSLTLTPTSGSATPLTLTIIELTDNSLIFEYPGALGKAENQVSVRVTAVPQ